MPEPHTRLTAETPSAELASAYDVAIAGVQVPLVQLFATASAPAYRAAVVAAEQAEHGPDQAEYQVSHGMTPSAVSVIGDPTPDPPKKEAIAPIGVTKVKG